MERLIPWLLSASITTPPSFRYIYILESLFSCWKRHILFTLYCPRVDLVFIFIFRFLLRGTGSFGWTLTGILRLPCLKVVMLLMLVTCWLIILTGITHISAQEWWCSFDNHIWYYRRKDWRRSAVRPFVQSHTLVRRNARTWAFQVMIFWLVKWEQWHAQHSGNAWWCYRIRCLETHSRQPSALFIVPIGTHSVLNRCPRKAIL